MNNLKIEEVQEVSLEIMKKVSEICEELGLKYTLMYGTMLGAIRHKAFIPWDDDLDIAMPRKDYEVLTKYLESNRDEIHPLKLYEHSINDAYPYMISRVSDERYVIRTNNEKDFGLGIFIDIYPFDALGSDYKLATKLIKKADKLASLCYRSTRLKPIKRENKILQFIEVSVFYYSKIMGRKHYMNKLEQLSRTYDYDSSNYVGCIVWASGGENEIFEKQDLEEIEEKKFGKYSFCVSKNYDKMLYKTYGNYLKLPPVEERIQHHEYSAQKRGNGFE